MFYIRLNNHRKR